MPSPSSPTSPQRPGAVRSVSAAYALHFQIPRLPQPTPPSLLKRQQTYSAASSSSGGSDLSSSAGSSAGPATPNNDPSPSPRVRNRSPPGTDSPIATASASASGTSTYMPPRAHGTRPPAIDTHTHTHNFSHTPGRRSPVRRASPALPAPIAAYPLSEVNLRALERSTASIPRVVVTLHRTAIEEDYDDIVLRPGRELGPIPEHEGGLVSYPSVRVVGLA